MLFLSFIVAAAINGSCNIVTIKMPNETFDLSLFSKLGMDFSYYFLSDSRLILHRGRKTL